MREMAQRPTIHYLTFYCIPEYANEQRRHSPSAQKMEYIIDVINRLGYNVNLVSLSESSKNRIFFPKKKKVSNHLTFFLCPHIPGRYRESISFRWFVHCYSKKHIKQGDILLVYHTNCMRNDLLEQLCKKRGLTLIYEVEEIYAYAHDIVAKEQVEEEKQFLQCADKYLFCTETLQKAVNLRNLPYAIVEGSYKWVRPNIEKFNDGKIHCVYGGIISSVKKGAFLTVEMAKYLPENYVVHILGFGEVDKLKLLIDQTKEERKCELIYEGLKKGEEYLEFISKCDVGLALQTIDKDLCNHSFPSKLVLYMASGLRVVAYKMDILTISQMAKKIKFYESDNPEEIAKVVISIKNNDPSENKCLMEMLDQQFMTNFENLISKKD